LEPAAGDLRLKSVALSDASPRGEKGPGGGEKVLEALPVRGGKNEKISNEPCERKGKVQRGQWINRGASDPNELEKMEKRRIGGGRSDPSQGG